MSPELNTHTQTLRELALKNSSILRTNELLANNKLEAVKTLDAEIERQHLRLTKYEAIIRLISTPHPKLLPADLGFFNIIQTRRAEGISDEATLSAATAKLAKIKTKIQNLEYDKVTVEHILQSQEDKEFSTELQTLVNKAEQLKQDGQISSVSLTSLAYQLSTSKIFGDVKSGIATQEHTSLLSELSSTLNNAINQGNTQSIRVAINTFIEISNKFIKN